MDRKTWTRVLAVTGALAVGLALALPGGGPASASHQGHPQGVDVQNTPLPVTLEAGEGEGSNTVNAVQSGDWDVSVNNFPASQDVNVTGGSVEVMPAPATRSQRTGFSLLGENPPENPDVDEFPPIDTSFVVVNLGHAGGRFCLEEGPAEAPDIRFCFSTGNDDSFETLTIPFHQPVPISRLVAVCLRSDNLACSASVYLVGA